MFFFFFFQAEDGIRDDLVTGVQTCALPIYILGYPLIPVGDIMYNVYQDGVLVETTTNTTTTLIGLANEISYDFTVEAFMASVPLSSNSVSTSATPDLIISWDTTSTNISYNTLDDRWELRIS